MRNTKKVGWSRFEKIETDGEKRSFAIRLAIWRAASLPNLYLSLLLLCIEALYFGLQVLHVERFSSECRKTEAKVITLVSHKGQRQYSEPSENPTKYIDVANGKRGKTNHDSFLVYFWLDYKVGRQIFKPIA